MKDTPSGTCNSFVTRIDVSEPGVAIKTLVSDRVNFAQTVLSFARENKTYSAMNASFYRWQGTGCDTYGPVVKMGELYSCSADFNAGGDFSASIYQVKGEVPQISYLYPHLSIVREDGETVDITSFNTNYAGQTTLSIQNKLFSNHSVGSKDYHDVSELVVKNGRMTDLRHGKPSITIPDHGFVVVSRGAGAALLKSIYKKGVGLKFDALANTSLNSQIKFSDMSFCVPGGAALLKDGSIPNTFSHIPGGTNPSDLHPRAAAGISKDGKQVFFIVADGRQPPSSVGLSMDALAQELKDLGAWSAVNFDGGASATMVTKSDGGLEIKNTPYRGSLRNVSCAIGVTYDTPQVPVARETPAKAAVQGKEGFWLDQDKILLISILIIIIILILLYKWRKDKRIKL